MYEKKNWEIMSIFDCIVVVEHTQTTADIVRRYSQFDSTVSLVQVHYSLNLTYNRKCVAIQLIDSYLISITCFSYK